MWAGCNRKKLSGLQMCVRVRVLFAFHPPVHSNSREREDRNIDCDWLNEEHRVAHGAAKHPPAGIEGVGESERYAGHAHEHVGEGQVPDEEVGDVVHLAATADDVEEQVVAKDADRHDQHIRGDDKGLERLQQGHICKLGAAVGRAVVHGNLVNVPVRLAALISFHGSDLDTQLQWIYSRSLSMFPKVAF